jgi:hypothetical protein
MRRCKCDSSCSIRTWWINMSENMTEVALEVNPTHSVCQTGGLLDFSSYPLHCVPPSLYIGYILSQSRSKRGGEACYSELTASGANYGTIEMQHFRSQDKMSKREPWRRSKHATVRIGITRINAKY